MKEKMETELDLFPESTVSSAQRKSQRLKKLRLLRALPRLLALSLSQGPVTGLQA